MRHREADRLAAILDEIAVEASAGGDMTILDLVAEAAELLGLEDDDGGRSGQLALPAPVPARAGGEARR